MWRPHRGTWVPLLPPSARIPIVTLVPVEPVVRGIDYALPGADNSAALSVVEAAMPMWVWGFLCLAAGLVALGGFLSRQRRAAVAGLWLGGSTYVALAAGQWWAVAGQPWLDGIRGPAIVTIFAVAQLGMAIGYAQQPDDIDPEDAP